VVQMTLRLFYLCQICLPSSVGLPPGRTPNVTPLRHLSRRRTQGGCAVRELPVVVAARPFSSSLLRTLPELTAAEPDVLREELTFFFLDLYTSNSFKNGCDNRFIKSLLPLKF